jgi:site-specific DNA-methyltransferase (adenine-specific)
MTPYYDHDGITIYHGDCREVLPTLPNLQRVDAVATDPPYASAAATATTGRAKAKSGGNWGDMSLVKLMVEATLAPLTGAHALWWFCDQHAHAAVVPVIFQRYQTVQTIVWDRDALGMGSGYRRQTEFIVHGRCSNSPVFTSNSERDLIRLRPPKRTTGHPAEKPVALMMRLLGPCAWTTVLDPYSGSGTTLLAAKSLGRKAIGIDIEERYCEIAAKRLSQEVIAFGAATPSEDGESVADEGGGP